MTESPIIDAINRKKFIRLRLVSSLYKITEGRLMNSIPFKDLFKYLQKDFIALQPEIQDTEVNDALIYLDSTGYVKCSITSLRGFQFASYTQITTTGIDFAEQLLSQKFENNFISYQKIAEAQVIQNYYQFFLGNKNANFIIGDNNSQTT